MHTIFKKRTSEVKENEVRIQYGHVCSINTSLADNVWENHYCNQQALESLRYSPSFPFPLISSLPFITYLHLFPLPSSSHLFFFFPCLFSSFFTSSSSFCSSSLFAKCDFTWLRFCHEDTLLASRFNQGGKCRKKSFFPLSKSVI